MNDSLIDYAKYSIERAANSASELADFVGDGISDMADSALDFVGDVLDFFV